MICDKNVSYKIGLTQDAPPQVIVWTTWDEWENRMIRLIGLWLVGCALFVTPVAADEDVYDGPTAIGHNSICLVYFLGKSLKLSCASFLAFSTILSRFSSNAILRASSRLKTSP